MDLLGWDCAYITQSLINSDVVENQFCQQRAVYNGASTNPSALQYRRNLNSIILEQNIVSNKANAEKPFVMCPVFSFKCQKTTKKKKKKKKNKTIIDTKTIKVIKL